jgi:PIN domain nuclease of toxin-antitoxin system
MSSPIILDTHVLLWSVLTPDKISDDIKQRIVTAQSDGELLISSISLWEIAMLQLTKRINIYEPIKDFLESIVGMSGLSIVEMSPEIIAESVLLMDDFHGDSADRMIVATAKCSGASLLTRDETILTWAQLGHIKSVKV